MRLLRCGFRLVGVLLVDPAEACVRKGGKAMWTNAGARAHRISADQRTWTAFTLAPGKSKSITFPTIGRHPYRMDAAPAGFIDVRTTCSAAGPSPDGGGSPGVTTAGQPGTRFVTYDVDVRATLTQKGQSFNGGLLAYEADRTLAWSGTFPRVRVEVREFPTGGWTANLGPGVFVESTERFTVQSRVLYQSISNPPPPPLICSAAVSLVLPTKLYLGGSGGFGSDASLGFGAGLTDEGAKALEAAEQAQYATPDCRVFTDSAGPPFEIDNGMKAQLYLGGFTPSFNRTGGSPKAPPIDALLRGTAFQITAGPRTTTDSCFGDTCSEEEHYVMSFRPAR